MRAGAALAAALLCCSVSHARADEPPQAPEPGPDPEQADEGPAAPSIPPDLAGAVAFAERRGRELYEHDQVAWRATDAVKPASRRWRGKLVGWITVPQSGDARPLVRFLSEPSPGVYASRADVVVGLTGARVEEHAPASPLPEDQQALARARALAIRERKRQCTKSLNPVVLRDASGEIHVYLLAASAKQDEIVLAGHDLARVSADGRTLLAWRPLSKSCMVEQRNPRAVMLFVTHVIDPSPTEAHVFTGLIYRSTLAVGTERGIWSIDAGEIRLIKPAEERNE